MRNLRNLTKEDIFLLVFSSFLLILFVGGIIKNTMEQSKSEKLDLNIVFSLVLLVFLSLFQVMGVLSVFWEKHARKLKKIYGISLMSFFVFLPFSLYVSIWLSLVIYGISTIGIVLYQKYK
ncbi:MAG: hypothetical protein NZ853_06005 [Leptospiraceae bacterium]|nr:hypothetical protein [Leptospiraceae bacterium]MDW7976496.1 hypothetical protein [Leptospiraceae bacterium]